MTRSSERLREQAKSRTERWPWLVAALLLASMGVSLVGVWRITNHHDLAVFLLAGQRILAGEDIYADAAAFQSAIEAGAFDMRDDTTVWPYAYPPLIGIAFAPLSRLPERAVQIGWWIANVAALLGGSWLCLRVAGPSTAWGAALALLLMNRFQPATVALRLGQIELVLFLLVAVALWALDRGREATAGLVLGLATALKLFPGALIALLFWRRRWRAALWASGTALALLTASYALVGFDAVGAYLRYARMYGIGGAFAAFPLNQSLNGFYSRHLTHNPFSATLRGWHLPSLAVGLTVASAALIVVLSAWLTWHRDGWPARPSPEARQRFALEYALAITALLIVSPHSQTYALVWLLLPLIVTALHPLRKQPGVAFAPSAADRGGQAGPLAGGEGGVGTSSRRRLHWRAWLGLMLAYLLVGREYVLFRPGLTRLVQAHYLVGMVLLWALLAFLLWRPGQRTSLTAIWRRCLGPAGG